MSSAESSVTATAHLMIEVLWVGMWKDFQEYTEMGGQTVLLPIYLYSTSTENQYITRTVLCSCPPFTAHPFFILTLHNHTSIESARSQHYNGVYMARLQQSSFRINLPGALFTVNRLGMGVDNLPEWINYTSIPVHDILSILLYLYAHHRCPVLV